MLSEEVITFLEYFECDIASYLLNFEYFHHLQDMKLIYYYLQENLTTDNICAFVSFVEIATEQEINSAGIRSANNRILSDTSSTRREQKRLCN